MKKMILMAVAMMMVAVNVKAQYEPGTWSIAPKVGGGFATMSNVDGLLVGTTNVDNKITYASGGGVEFEYQVNKYLGLAAGVMYNIQGTRWDDFTQDGVKMEDPRVELEYISLPIVANVYVTKGLAFKAGVQMGFLVDADIKMTSKGKMMGRDTEIDTNMNMNKDFKKFDVSIPVGVSYEFNDHFLLEARYHIGLTKVNDKELGNGKDSKNGMFLVNFGYKFSL